MTATHGNDIGDNLSQASALLSGEDDEVTELPARPSKSQAKRVAAQAQVERRVKIILQDNDQIPPGGQFIGVNGKTFLLQPNHEIEVPESVLDVLDHAITSVPIVDDSNTVIGYRDRLRFPYSVVRDNNRR